jgi:uncharacterized metal-binding protein YceD (DUF177 family)
MSNKVLLKRPGVEVGDTREFEESFEARPFDLYGRHHEVLRAGARITVTRLAEGVHLDLSVAAAVETTCDRTLEPFELHLEFGESEFLAGPDDRELSVEDWTLDLTRYTERALPNEVPMKACAPGTQPVKPEGKDNEVDPRWRGLDDLFASGF